jgi:hypothetical protein
MKPADDSCSCYTRRRFVDALGVTAAGAASLLLPKSAAAADSASPAPGRTYNGSTDPYPVPWLDKFGDHHQAAGPNAEPSDIYHFKGKIARCAGFSGMGTDNQGNRIAFGAPSTDWGMMQGTYFAARTEQTGSFAHL